MSDNKKRGGKREGAGRIATEQDKPYVETVTAKVDAELKEFVQQQPEGESGYIRSVLSSKKAEGEGK